MDNYESALRKIEEAEKCRPVCCCIGPQGPEGTQGPEGPQGPSGGVASYGFIYTLADEETDTIEAGDNILFSNNGPLLDIEHSIGSDEIIIKNTGTYLINYIVNATGGPNAVIALAVNDIVDASTNVDVLTANTHVAGTAILNLTENDVLTVTNNSEFDLTIDETPIVGAQITIIQIA